MSKRTLSLTTRWMLGLVFFSTMTTVHGADVFPYLEGVSNNLPSSLKSDRYEVSVRKGNSGGPWKSVHVYKSDNDIVTNTGWLCLGGFSSMDCKNPDEDVNNDIVTKMTDSNHWVSFDVEDSSSKVEVRVKSIKPGCGFSLTDIEGDLNATPPVSPAQARDMIVHPKLTNAWTFKYISANTLAFDLWLPSSNNWPQQFYLKLPGNCHEDNPLLVFPNKREFVGNEDPNNPGCKLGDEIIGEDSNGNSPVGKQVNVDPGNTDGVANGYGQQSLILDSSDSGKTYCIPGGAYVRGRIVLEGASNVTIRGRGILSGIPFRHYDVGTWSGTAMIEAVKSGTNNALDLSVEGITITDAPRGLIESHKQMTVNSVKLFGWHVNTDGVSGSKHINSSGDTLGTVVEDTFFKVNDDNVKMTSSGATVNRLVVWHQTAGSVVQISWNNFLDAENSTLDGMVLIEADRDSGSSDLNSSIIAVRNMMGGRIKNYTFSNITAEVTPHSFLILQLDDQLVYKNADRKNKNNCLGPGFVPTYNCQLLDGDGRILNLTFDTITIPGQPPLKSRIDDNEDVPGEPAGLFNDEFKNEDIPATVPMVYHMDYYDWVDLIKNITLKDVFINGSKITASNVGTHIDIASGVTGMVYQ